MKCELRTICDFRKGKIEVSKLNQSTYISTENMVPDKGGVVDASSLPNSLTTQEFQPGDILVSNIRPYFKKIWHAKYSGGCSNDVLVFTAKGGVDPAFLYYLLSDDAFFSFSTATSKGTKMPRGDRKAIMQYAVPQYDLPTQKKIGSILRSLDDKIELNNKINENLEQQAQTIYQEWFGNVDAVKRPGKLSDICTYSKERVAVSELDVSTYFSTENMLSGKAGAAEASSLPTTALTTACHIGDTLISNIRPYFKKIVYCHEECGCSTDVLCFVPVYPKYSAYLYNTLYADRFFDFMVAGSKGTKMPRGDKQQIMTYPVRLPTDVELEAFNSMAIPILTKIQNNRTENKRLSILRDTLLPKLMNGEITCYD